MGSLVLVGQAFSLSGLRLRWLNFKPDRLEACPTDHNRSAARMEIRWPAGNPAYATLDLF
jgi:hypothetical protein